MPDIFAETARDFRWFGEHAGHLLHPGDTQAPDGRPATVENTTTTEEPMTPADLHALATRLEHIGEDGLAKTEAILANPATADLFSVLHSLAVPGLGDLSPVFGAVRTLLQAYVPAPAAAAGQQPAA